MSDTFYINIDKLSSEVISDLQKKFKNKFLEIKILDEEEYLLSSEKMKNRLYEAYSREGGISLEDFIEKYNL
jgi:hypothetical protein